MQEQGQELFASEKNFEDAFVALLQDCGWKDGILNFPTEEDLKQNWAKILFENNREIDRLGNFPLTKGEMNQILEQIKTLRVPFELNSFINGKTVSVKRDNENDTLHFGKEVSLHIYDRLEIAGGKSRYQIARQPKINARKNLFPNRRGDVMLLINGMPVFHIELKSSCSTLKEACYQIEKYSSENIFTGIFALVQIFVAMTPNDAVYFANPGEENFNDKFRFRWADFDNEPIKNWKKFTKDLLHIPMAHELIGFYTIPDSFDCTLKVLRSYQYFAIKAIADAVSKNKWGEQNQRGGFVWHTTGSGKTLTSFKAADLISKSGDADKVVFLVDRIELGTQSLDNYKCFADDKDDVQGTENTDILVEKLKSENPSNTLIVTSIQKMSRISENAIQRRKKDIDSINKKRLVFIVDECHRDTFGDMMACVKKTFPNALLFGFTGTPITDENKKKGCTSSDVFGNELHRYTIADGIRDKNVLPFDPHKVLTFKDSEIKKIVAQEKVHATQEEALGDEKKCDAYNKIFDLPMTEIEKLIPKNQYKTKEHTNAVVNDILEKNCRISSNGKFHAIFATSSIPEAIEYYRLFKSKSPELKTALIVDPSDDNKEGNIEKIQGLSEVVADYNARYGTKFAISTYAEMKKDISLRLKHATPYRGKNFTSEKQIDLLIVVHQMLTGFDSKWINAIYLDKVMEQENIIQAFSRTNRIFAGSGKPHGTIFYYRMPHTMQKNIEKAVETYSGNKEYMVFVDGLEKNLEKFNGVFLEIKDLFEGEGIADFSHLPENFAACKKFVELFGKLNRTLETIKVQGFFWEKAEYQFEKKLKKALLGKIEYEILCARYLELPKNDGDGEGEKEIPFSLDSYITEIETGKIDSDYINSRFEKFFKIKFENENDKKQAENALQELYKSFSLLSPPEQKYAKIFIDDVKSGNLIPQEGKTFKEYISQYAQDAQNTRVFRFAKTFSLDEKSLCEIMKTFATEKNLNEFNRFEKLAESADKNKIKEYYKEKGENSVFKANMKFKNLLKDFILKGGDVPF